MRVFLRIVLLALLFTTTGSNAASVEYQHPELTIVAVNETLDSVLKTLGREMRITVRAPEGLNPVINCDIQKQPIKRAFRTLLGDMSYSLVWEDNGTSLAGLVILSGEGEPSAATAPQKSSFNADVTLDGTPSAASIADVQGGIADSRSIDHSRSTEATSRREAMLADREARMAEENETRKAENEARLREELIALEARRAEAELEQKAWVEDYLETYGPKRAD